MVEIEVTLLPGLVDTGYRYFCLGAIRRRRGRSTGIGARPCRGERGGTQDRLHRALTGFDPGAVPRPCRQFRGCVVGILVDRLGVPLSTLLWFLPRLSFRTGVGVKCRHRCWHPLRNDDQMQPFRRNETQAALLSRLHEESDAESIAQARAQFHGSDEQFNALLTQYRDLPPERRGALLQQYGIAIQDPSLSLAISREMGVFLFQQVLACGATRILELGSSNGVSTLYLAEALRLQGRGGRVVATELEPDKCTMLRRNVDSVGLSSYVDLYPGDVFETVKQLQGPFDLVFIDIWASGYLELFRAIEPLLRSGSVILADNMFTAAVEVQPFKDYLDGHPSLVNFTLPFESGVEYVVVI